MAILGTLSLVAAFLAFSMAPASAANPSANLDQCANGSLASPNVPACNPDEWVNGNVNESKAHYLEGDSIPYRLRLANLALSSHTVTIEWDTTKSGKHALDYITSFDRTVTTANPCTGVANCNTFTTFAIPADPQVTGAGVTPVAGNFTLYGGTITAVSAYSYPNGAGFAGDKSARISITFTASKANPVLAWGGHIAARQDWGLNASAVSIPGSPYHTRLIDLDGSGGNQDRSLSAGAVIFPGSITIVKDAVPDDAQDFGYTTTGGLLPATFSLDDDADGTLSNTQLYSGILNFTTYTVSETTVTGWALSFNTPVCTVTTANGGSQTASSPTVTINLKEGENVSCTFVNTRQAAHLTVTKVVVNDDGGTKVVADFPLFVDGGSVTSGVQNTFSPGSHTVSETGATGYVGVISGDCAADGSITLSPGDVKACTITNDDIAPKLTVTKVVVNDNGGTKAVADFPLFVDGGSVTSGVQNSFNAGSHTVSETGDAAYTATISGDCAADGTVTLGVGDVKACTITNDDIAPGLTVIKNVINDNGGTATASQFTMSVTATNPNPASFPGDETGTVVTLDAGSYSVGETGPAGYAATYSAGCSGTLAAGGSAVCTVTNDDIAPKLTVTKVVVNDNGGTKVVSDFPLFVDGGSVTSGVQNSFNTGAHTVSETGDSGYTATISGDCAADGTITLGLADVKACTITNDDKAAHLIVIKTVINDNGGTATASQFTLDSGGTNDTPDNFAGAEAPGTDVTLDAGSYNVTESGPSGYAASFSSECSGSIANGQTKTCTVTNDDIQQVESQITPTATTCSQFASGTSATLDTLEYSVKSGKISQVNPGVFFYWVKVDATAGSNTFTINQTITTGNFNTYFSQAAGSNVFTSSCTVVKPPASITTVNGVTTITFDAATAGQYIIGIKYNASSVKGVTAPDPTTVHYQFQLDSLATSIQGIDLVKKP